MSVLLECMCVHVPDLRGGQKRTFDPLELELQTVVSHHVGAGKPGLSPWARGWSL